MEQAEITIIGAGVVGLAAASQLSRYCKNIFVIEKEAAFGRGTSSRNSEVIHAGIYYPKESLKAQCCVEGRRLLYELCEKQKIPFKKLGKLIVATCDEEIEQVRALLRRGSDNGVEGLEIIDAEKIRELEPAVKARCALYSPESGIVDSHALMAFFAGRARDNGASIAYQSKVEAIEKCPSGYKITTRSPDGEVFCFESEIVINAAGLFSDEIAAMAGIDTAALGYALHFCKGEYFRLSAHKSTMARRLVYPVPEQNNKGLGIHLTPDLSGQLRLGPDAEYMGKKEEDYSVDIKKKRHFFESVSVFAPFIAEADLSPDTAGIRPKLQEDGGQFRDFVIAEESKNGFAGLINCIGIESPGLTASLAIARRIENLLPIRKK